MENPEHASEGNKKYKVLIFLPTRSCACNFAHFMDEVFKIYIHYKKSLLMDTKDLEDPLAKTFNVHKNSIVFLHPPENENQNEPRIFTSALQFKHYLDDLAKDGYIEKS